MEFKIDTRPSHMLITPIANELNANLAEALAKRCNESDGKEAGNYIIDLHNVITADASAFDGLAALHEECYGSGRSLVFTNINDDVLTMLRENEVSEVLNLAPTMAEAVDIVSMEILERELFNED